MNPSSAAARVRLFHGQHPGAAPGAAPKTGRCAFTLLELLLALTIIVILFSLLMTMYGVIREAMLVRSTDNVLRKVDAALRLFRNEVGVYPYQPSYPDPVSGTSFPNNLHYRIGSDISWAGSPSDAARVKADIAVAVGKFNDASPGPLTYLNADFSGARTLLAGRFNTAARERARLAVLAGNLTQSGPLICDVHGATVSDRRSPVLTVAERTSMVNSSGAGWACDYLGGDLEAKYIRGDAILDAWQHPLVYINQQVPGVKTAVGGGHELQIAFDGVRYGLGPQGFDSSSGPAAGLVGAGRGLLLYCGRILLSQSNAGDGRPTPTDALYFPDVGNLMGSDLRYYAAPGFQLEFELWSAGRDGRFGYMRNDPGNRDNRAAGAYDRELR